MEIKAFEQFSDVYGNDVFTYDYVQQMRDEDRKKRKKNFIAAQRGPQEDILSSKADVSFVGGARGGSKSFSILLESLKDISDPNFNAVILRHEKPDLENLIEDSKRLYKDYGYFLSSDRDMRWKLSAGGTITFNYHAGLYEDFKVRFQGKQYSYEAVDEITHIDWDKFLYLLTCLRNANGLRNRFIGSCNPDKRSWVRQFISWYIGPDGYPIKERNGVLRYFFMSGSNKISDIVWGNSREEVYEKVKDQIDSLWDESMRQFGDPKDIFIMSFTFIEAKVTDNIKLLENDPKYIARLANQSYEQVMADLRGNWDADHGDDDYVEESEMEEFFNRPPDFGDGVLRMAQDLAFEGGDLSISWLLRGNCIVDLDVCQLNSRDNINHTQELKRNWGVQDQNHVFDSNGIGQSYKGYFPRAIPFNNQETPYGFTENDKEIAKRDYDTLKSQCAYSLADALKYGELTISKHLLDRRFSGRGFENLTLREIFLQERKFFNVDETKRDAGKGKCLKTKKEIKKWLHRSPDFTEALVYSRIFWVKKTQQKRTLPRGYTRYVRR